MADTQRRYMLRARARPGTTTTGETTAAPPSTLSAPATRAPKRIPEKRKALNDSSNSATEPPSSLPVPRSRAAKKPATASAATSAPGLKAAPVRRSARTAGKGAASTEGVSAAPVAGPSRAAGKSAAAAKPAVKKVSFASPVADDKENAPPPAKSKQDEDVTDVNLSASLGALSVKPKRTRQSKLKPPTGSLLGPVPELSPLKAKRLPRKAVKEEEDEVDDVLFAPVSPGLSARPVRVAPFSAKKNPLDGAELLQKDPLKASTLYGSPARRPVSPKKSAIPEPASAAPKPNGLSSPAKRPVGGSRLASTKKPTTSSLKYCMTMADEDTLSEDELAASSKPVDRVLFKPSTASPAKSLVAETNDDPFAILDTATESAPPAKMEVDVEELDRKIAALSPAFPVSPPSATTAPEDPVSPTPAEQKVTISGLDSDGDVFMDDNDPAPAPAPVIKKHRSPSEGGSSYGFFPDDTSSTDDDDTTISENDENAENIIPSDVPAPANMLDEMDLDRAREPHREFGQVLEDHTGPTAGFDAVPIDPALTASDDIIVNYSEVTTTTTVPIKMHSVDDDDSDHEMHDLPSAAPSSPRRRRNSGVSAAPTGVLAGAVVYLDVHTSDGVDASSSFAELLRELGARVLKRWEWNPASGDKIGITHVVFKEGSPRTLSKLKATNGIVRCVGVSWVNACVAEQRWVEEETFAVDLDHIPRGGARRRKSMEPKAIVLDKPASTQNSPVPATPEKKRPEFTKPLRTEPPKMLMLTPALRLKVMEARRKSMQYAPKVGSPLRGGWVMEP